MYTDGSRMLSGAAGYSVVWRKAQRWVGIKSHMGYNQEAFDAESATLARAGSGGEMTNPTGQSHDFHGFSGSGGSYSLG
jgi:hypothetical protein